MNWNDINWSILMNLYGRGMALTRQTVFAEFKQDIWKIVFKLGNLLEKFNAHGRVGTSVRNPPVTIYLAGGTGVGKSSVTYPLAAEILKGIFQREPSPTDLAKYWKNLIYMRSPEQEFWDGYENQLVTVFDDFGQLVDSTSSPNLELFEIIRAANSFPYPLHMASLDQKATTTFNSKIILVSSNLDQPKTASLNFETALFRRFDICVKVTRKPGVVVTPGVFDPNIYMFQEYDMVTQKLGEFISYKDLIYASVTKYFARKGFVDSMDDYITKVLAQKDAPKQQGLGTALGNSVCAVKSGMKNTLNYVCDNYRDFKGAVNGQEHYRYMTELRLALENFRYKLMRVGAMWENFKIEHKYLYKAMKFLGIISLVFGVIKLYNSFTATEEKKPKLMSSDQFIKSGNFLKYKQEAYNAPNIKQNPRVESYTDVQIKNPKVEAYSDVQIKNPKVEFKQLCEHEYRLVGKSEHYHLIDNARCELCKVDSKNQGRVFGPQEEGYNPPNLKNPRVEFMGFGPLFVCQHQIEQEWKKNPFRVIFLKKSKTCEQCSHIEEEGVKDLNASEVLMKCIRSNFYKIYSLDTAEAIGHCLFLRGRIVMCPRHYITAFRHIQGSGGSNKVYLQNVFLDRAFEVDVSEILNNAYFHESPEENGNPVLSRDIMAFPLKTATFHANIIPYFADKSNLSFVHTSDVVMPVLMENNLKNSSRAIVAFRFSKGRSGLAVKEETQIDNEFGIPQRIMRNIWEYSMDTQAAECGAPLIVRNVNITPGKIVGMHVAGHDTNGLGYATPIYKNDVETIVSKFNEWDSVEFRLKQNFGEYPTQQCQVPENAEFIRIGSIDRPVAQPTKTKIAPSPIFGKIKDHHTRPCALRPVEVDGKSFDPRSYRLGRLGNIPQFINQLEIDLAMSALVDDISQNIQHLDFGPNIKSVYSFEEAVVGIDGEEFINSIKRNTSPGYPFVHLKGFESRKQIFGDDEKCDMDRIQCKILQQRVNDIIENCKNGIVSEHIFMDTLKDERKPMHKAHKTRLFSAGPLDYLIACKQYFNGIVAVLQKSRNLCGISVGTNVYSSDWSTIARVLLSKSNNVVAGDFEGFDASQVVQLLEAAGKVLIKLSQRFCGTTDEEAYIMWCLLISLFNSVHVTGKEIYMWTHSLPSGHYLTAIINSIFVLISFCVVYQLHKQDNSDKKTSYLLARSFYKRFGKVAYGDDHVITVPQDEQEFNQQTLKELFARIGLSYTMEDKDAVATEKFRRLDQVAYLKRKFVFNKEWQRWLGPLDLDTVLESPMWIHKCPDPISQVATQIDNSLRELSIHEEDVWNKWYPVFAKCGKQIGHYTDYVYHADTRAEVLG
uniref:Putative non-structural polyprotein n=1 Tax=Anoplolepis gracilipes virus 2 TaxID=2804527 RepID=A0A7U0FXA5_9VIRU|nr:putative non-structural polyprotein [Anoplolepis gracilipes virus 2]